ncbi:terpene synthase family protein [Planomonospora sp. ID82291]|uniref:terpene synthase family protein n=1 Tax=Planomonospora sp. ID82291 TaxID=2738136 RepID=UPI0018C38A00|nr:terpene synthase family protein [Planomonospora sp. ID82291]MBG0816219.1 hypothetical protein [Planomonospora sp. ID82291]
MRTELRTPPRTAALLAPLTERLAALSAPCPMHPSVHRIEAALIEWSRLAGLEVDRAAALHRVAGRAFARCDVGAATLFARWLAWARRFREESDAYTGVLMAAEGADPGPRPVERAFAGLWRESAAGMSREWRERFLAGLTAQRAALLDAASSAPPPTRSRAVSGPYLFDLAEPCLGVEVPAPVAADRRWRALVEASGDVVTWCDDLAAGHRTAGHGHGTATGHRTAGHGHGHGTATGHRTAGHGHGHGTATATGHRTAGHGGHDGRGDEAARVVERLVARTEELWTAALTVPVLVERHGLGLAAGRDVTRVACAFLTVSRAHLEHLRESGPAAADPAASAQEAQTSESPTGVRR